MVVYNNNNNIIFMCKQDLYRIVARTDKYDRAQIITYMKYWYFSFRLKYEIMFTIFFFFKF
jgi:hypothetical protein